MAPSCWRGDRYQGGGSSYVSASFIATARRSAAMAEVQSLRAAANSPSTEACAMSSNAEPVLRSQIVTTFNRSSARSRRRDASSDSPAARSPLATRASARA